LILVKLNGGLGNQLFQYAAGFALAQKNRDELKVDLSAFDTHAGSQDTLRTPDILKLSINASIATSQEVEALKNPMGMVSRGIRFVRQRILKRYYVDWHPEILSLKGNAYLEGYFQSENYFRDYISELFQEFSLNEEIEKEICELNERITALRNPVSLHVRRGDYVSNPKIRALHHICTPQYFEQALVEMKSQLGKYDLVVFSDDISWVREHLTFEGDVIYVSDEKTVSGEILTAPQEMTLMSRCRHHIISNSTFSWWGAHLNRKPGKVVIAPDLWNRSKFHTHENILPKSWLKIAVS
jgi:hypothetical protein